MKKPLYLNNIDTSSEGMENDKFLDNLLKEELPFTLPDDFAGKVAQRMVRQTTWKMRMQHLLVYAAVILGCFLVVGVILYYFSGEDRQEWAGFVTKNSPLLVALSIIWFFVIFVDRLVLPILIHSKFDDKNPNI